MASVRQIDQDNVLVWIIGFDDLWVGRLDRWHTAGERRTDSSVNTTRDLDQTTISRQNCEGHKSAPVVQRLSLPKPRGGYTEARIILSGTLRDSVDTVTLQLRYCDVTASPLLLAMSKRGPSGSSSKPRKRKWKGVSTTTSILDFTDTPPSETQVMQVWHSRVEDPTTSQKSTVPIPPEPQIKGTDAGSCRDDFEDSEDIALTSTVVSAGPKRRRGNDSVSYTPKDLKIY